MSFSAIALMNMAFALRPQWWIEDVKFDWKNIAGGVGLAVVLWGVFWLGDKASAWLFDFARPQVELIYGMKTGENPWLLSILLLISLCIGTYLVVQLYAGDGGVGGWCYLGIGLQIVSSEIGSIDCVACSVGCGGICCVSDLMTHHRLHGFTQMKKYIFDFPALYLCKSV